MDRKMNILIHMRWNRCTHNHLQKYKQKAHININKNLTTNVVIIYYINNFV